MSREHYDACFRYGIKSSPDEKCNCHEFDKALEWTMPYIFSTLREKVEGLDKRIVNVSLLEQYTVNRYFVCLDEVLSLLDELEK